jgi:nickel transport protein
MKFRGLMMFFLAMIFLLPPQIYAHGVRGKVDAGGMVVTAEYDDGEPMSYARVEISAPDSKLPFQSGRTDRNGRFCFFPDTPGDWKVVVSDEMGHRLEVIVPVGEAMQLKTNQQAGGSVFGSLSGYARVIIGISIIFGIFGSLLGWAGYKKLKDELKP